MGAATAAAAVVVVVVVVVRADAFCGVAEELGVGALLPWPWPFRKLDSICSFADVVALVSTRMSGLVVVVVVVEEEESGEAGGVFVSGPVGVCTVKDDIDADFSF